MILRTANASVAATQGHVKGVAAVRARLVMGDWHRSEVDGVHLGGVPGEGPRCSGPHASLPAFELVVALVVFAVLVAEPVSKLGPEVMGARHIVG
jgi:hypothetical protein